MKLSQEQILQLEELLDEPWAAIGPAMAKNMPFFVLKAINDQIRTDGLDDFYDLDEKGSRLQALYEAIYQSNRDLLEK